MTDNGSSHFRFVLNEIDVTRQRLFRLKKDSSIRFELSPLLSCKKVRLFSNLVRQENDRFERSNFVELKWSYEKHEKYDDSDRHSIVRCCRPGTFDFFFTTDGSK